MLKYSLGTLFLIMAIVGVGCAAVANYSDVWAEAMVTLTVVMLLLSVLVAVFGRRGARPFAAGFAIAGGTYFLLTFIEGAGVRDELLTTRAVDRLYQWNQKAGADSPNTARDYLPGMVGGYGGSGYGSGGEEYDDLFGPGDVSPPGAGMSGYGMNSRAGVMGMAMLVNAPPVLQDIGHALWTLVFALAGGVAAQVIQRTSRKREAVT